MRAFRVRALALVAVLFVLPGAGLLAQRPVDIAAKPEDPSADRQAAEQRFRATYPRARMLRQQGDIVAVYGSPFSTGDTPVAAAELFRNEHIEMFGVRQDELRPMAAVVGPRHVQPLMYLQETGEYKFTLVSYSQFKNELPVFRSDLRLLVRNQPDHPLVKATVALRDLGSYSVPEGLRADLDHPPFVDGRLSVARERIVSEQSELTEFSEADVVIWAGIDGERVLPRPALRFRGHNFTPGGAQDQHWLFLTDVETGEILYRENLILTAEVIGNVSGMASGGIGADICEAEVETPMRYLRVSSGGGSVFADDKGDYTIPNGGSTVQATTLGRWFRIFNAAGAETSESESSTFDLLFNANNNSEQTRAQVNAYVEANRVRDYVARFNPAYPTFTDTSIETNTNLTGGLCPGNAWYSPFDGSSPSGYSINFCQSGTNRPNTAFSSVVHHEFGHHLVRAAGSGQDQYGEGMGDVVSLLVLDSPSIGLGFFNNCTSSLRNADNNLQYPCNGEAHSCGNLISGAVWDVRGKMIGAEPVDYRDVLSNIAINSMLMHNGGSITPQITIDYLTLDDDDNNIANGTPHYDEINAGFAAHNMAAPPILFGMGVLPANDFVSAGESGGPFSPSNVVYSIENYEEGDLSYSVVLDRPWLSVDSPAGVLAPGESVNVTVSFNEAAEDLQGGVHTGTVQFVNNVTHIGDVAVAVELEVDHLQYPGSGGQSIPPFQTVENTIDIAESACIDDLNVQVQILFQGLGSLSVELESPSGEIVRLHAPGLDTGNNLFRTYDEEGGTNPAGPGSLSDFRYTDIQGTWTLRMRSISLVNTGTLSGWSLDVQQLGPDCPPQADAIDVEVPTATTSPIVLDAQSITGGSLSYRVATLPANGQLFDPDGGEITTVPYTLANDGDTVLYFPSNGYIGKDRFEFVAFDGASSLPTLVNIQSGVQLSAGAFDMNSDPGWTAEGGWEFGPPGGGGDPGSAFSGSNVYGYNLGGNYANLMSSETLTSGPIDCSGLVGVEASFARWLGVESAVFDRAAFQVSTDGVSWSTVWENGTSVIDENAWSVQTYDISGIANRQPTVYLRWIMGETDSSETYQGWNLDDVELRGVPEPPTIRLSVDPGGLSWTALQGTSIYDVTRGDLGTLRGSAGDFESATDDCLGNNIGGTSLAYGDDPAIGQGIWFLVRGDSAPAIVTYDSYEPSQIQVRDVEIAAAAATCP